MISHVLFVQLKSHHKIIGHFRVPKNLTFKARLSAKPLIWKWFLIMIQIKLIFTTKVSHLASFWEWDFLELGNGLLESRSNVELCWVGPFCFVLFCFVFFLTRDYRDMTLIQEVEAYLPKLIQTCYLSSGRSIAHKCSRLLMMCAR